MRYDSLRANIIDSTNELEQELSQKIVIYFSPKHPEELFSILLNSSVISFGGKVKALKGLGLIETDDQGRLRELLSIRNAFAHSTINWTSYKSWFIQKDNYLKVMNAEGDVKLKEIHELSDKFYAQLFETKDILSSYNGSGGSNGVVLIMRKERE